MTLHITWLGTSETGSELIAPLRGAGTVVSDEFGPLSIGRLGEVTAEPTDATPGLDWSGALTGLDDAVVAALIEAVGDRKRTALVSVQLRHIGGALADPVQTPAATHALPGEHLAFALGLPVVPELVGPIQDSIRAVAEALAPVLTGGTTLTLLGPGRPLSVVFDDRTLDRLRAVKARIDPDRVIRGNHPLG